MNVMRSEETMGVQGGNLGGIPGYPCDNIDINHNYHKG